MSAGRERTVVRPYDFLLDAGAGWRLETPADRDLASEDTARGIEAVGGRLTLAAERRPGSGTPRARLLARLLPAGMAVWRDRVLVADPERHRLWHADPCCGPPRLLAGIGPRGRRARRLDRPVALAIDGRGDLAVVEAGNRRLQVFTLPDLALRRRLEDPGSACGVLGLRDGAVGAGGEGDGDQEAPDDGRWRPVDVVADGDGGLLVADRGGRIWRLDRQGRPDPRFAGRLEEGAVPERLARAGDGTIWVALEARDDVLRLDRFGRPLPPLEAGALGPALARLPAPPLALEGDRFVLAPAVETCRRHPLESAVSVDGEGRMRLPAGRGPGPFLRRPAPPARFPTAAVARFQPLDSGREKNRWHRLALELEIPERTTVELFAFTSDVLRPDVASPEPEGPAPAPWQAAPSGADEWLLQAPEGRFLHLAVRLRGPGDRAPALERVYVYASRDTSLRFLPAVYREDETGRSVLERLLALTDTVREEIETEIEGFFTHLDPEAVPDAFLPWLASFFDLDFEPTWDSATRRRVLAEIVTLYGRRGTARGLERLLALHTGLEGPLPRVVERFRAAGRPALERWFDRDDGPGPDPARRVDVLLPAESLRTAEQRLAFGRLLAANLPAGAGFRLRAVTPGFRLGDAVAGFDTRVGTPRPWRLPAADQAAGTPIEDAGFDRRLGARAGDGGGLRLSDRPPAGGPCHPSRNDDLREARP